MRVDTTLDILPQLFTNMYAHASYCDANQQLSNVCVPPDGVAVGHYLRSLSSLTRTVAEGGVGGRVAR